MLITISGLSGSGKTTTAKLLSRRIGVPTVDVGGLWRELAARQGMDVIAFGKYAERHPEVDRKLDDAMLAKAKKGRPLILQARLAGLMTKRAGMDAFRVWIDASPRIRAKRVAGREGIPFRRALRDVMRRDRDNRRRYMKTYGLDLNDLSVYDSVIRTDNLTVKQAVSALIRQLPPVWQKKQRQPPNPRRKRPKRPLKRLRLRPRRPRPSRT